MASLREISYVSQTTASLYCKHLHTHCKIVASPTHPPAKLLPCQGPPRAGSPPFRVNGTQVLKPNRLCTLEKQPPFPSQDKGLRVLTVITMVKAEVGRSALHWEPWKVISQQTRTEHFLCARHHASLGDAWQWRQIGASSHGTPGLAHAGLQEGLGKPSSSSELLQGPALVTRIHTLCSYKTAGSLWEFPEDPAPQHVFKLSTAHPAQLASRQPSI